ncbi:tyrosine-protein phosphatase, partial [Streptomyces yangpuensis]|uniref:tyrosine-protein phosphatase n=1 Tax=Streptomyces yangpuensis TaxID=1648182 RepID=UPI00366355EA
GISVRSERGAAPPGPGGRRSSASAEARSPEVMELLAPLFDARAEYLIAAFDTIDEVWGGVERYLAEGGGGVAGSHHPRPRPRVVVKQE